jgi:hypothetical protein
LLRFMAFFLCRYEDIYTNLETKQGRQVLLSFMNSAFSCKRRSPPYLHIPPQCNCSNKLREAFRRVFLVFLVW